MVSFFEPVDLKNFGITLHLPADTETNIMKVQKLDPGYCLYNKSNIM